MMRFVEEILISGLF